MNRAYGSEVDLIIMGEMDKAFFKGLGVHPKNPKQPVNGSIESWTTYDVSGLDCDRFYSAVGITNDKGKDGASKGVVFRVYADYDGTGNYKLLAHSGYIGGRDSGEFDLDITGVKTLKLVVVSAADTHASSASAWGNACVYSSKSVTDTNALELTYDYPEIQLQAKPEEPAEQPEEPATDAAPAAAVPVGLIVGLATAGVAVGAAGGIGIFAGIKRKKNSK